MFLSRVLHLGLRSGAPKTNHGCPPIFLLHHYLPPCSPTYWPCISLAGEPYGRNSQPKPFSTHACKPPDPWSKKLFSLSRIPELQHLTFSTPVCQGDRVVPIYSKEEVDRTEDLWKDVMHADKRLFFPFFLSSLEKRWNVKGSLENFQRFDNSIIFVFGSQDETNKILSLEPWFVLGRYLHLRPWSRAVRSCQEFFTMMPVWIRLPNLLLYLWSPSSIEKIVSIVSRPLYLDNYSTKSSRIRFIHVCAKISTDKSPPSSIQVEVEGCTDPPFEQLIEYETSFKICAGCKVFGHIDGECANAVTPIVTLSSQKIQAKKSCLMPSIEPENGVGLKVGCNPQNLPIELNPDIPKEPNPNHCAPPIGKHIGSSGQYPPLDSGWTMV